MEHDFIVFFLNYFIVFFLNYCLDHYFKSKADMARQIDVNACTLMRVMNPPYHFKAGSVPFQNTCAMLGIRDMYEHSFLTAAVQDMKRIAKAFRIFSHD